MKSILKALCAMDGVSGDEGVVRSNIRAMVEPFADEIREDRQGNLCVLRRGSASGDTVRMVCAHMDEVGFIVNHIDDHGYLMISPVGGIDLRVAMGRRLRVHGQQRTVFGITGLTPVHLADEEERQKTPKQLYLDIGASSHEEAETVVAVGDFATFVTEPADLGEGMFKAKAIDDRLGCAVMIELLRTQAPCAYDTWFVFYTREEVGGAGAKAASFALDPTEALVLEGTTAADVASVDGPKRVCCAGKGPVISYMDRSAIYNPEMFRQLLRLAADNGIQTQTKMLIAGGTDAGSITVSRAGIPCAGISAPVRYLHAPASVVSWADCEAILKLTALYLKSEKA